MTPPNPLIERAPHLGDQPSSPAPRLADLLAANLRAISVGAAPDLELLLGGLSLRVSRAESVEAIGVYAAAPLDLIILDAARWTASDWRQARDTFGIGGVPMVLLEREGRDDAQDYAPLLSVRRPLDRGALERALAVMIEQIRLRRMVECSGLMFDSTAAWLIDAALPSAPLVWVSPAFERQIGYGPTELLGKGVDALAGAQTDPQDLQALVTASRERRAVRLNLLVYRADGSAIWGNVALDPIHDSAGQVRWLLGSLRDTTAERPDTMGFFVSLLEDLPSGVLTADRNGKVTFISKNGLRTLSEAEELLDWRGRPMAEVLQLPPEVNPTRQHNRFSYRYRRPDGRTLELGVGLSCAPGVHPDIHWFAMFRDLTANREEELATQRMQRLAAIGTMVAGFAHEVRNPVSAMRSLIEGLEEAPSLEDPEFNFLPRLMRHLDRIERLVQRSLKFGRPVEPMRTLTTCGTIVGLALEDVRSRTRELELRISHRQADGLPQLMVDEGMLVQALGAILNNAIDVSAGGAAVIEITSDRYQTVGGDRGVAISVQDQGPGIPNHVIGHIFDPFYTTKADGTGLGLSIAQRLVHDNGGRLGVSSTPGAGTTFTIYLPTKAAAKHP